MYLFAGLHRAAARASFNDVARTLVPVVLTSTPTYAPLVAALALAYVEVSPWTAPLFFVPAIAAHRLYQLYHQQRQLADDLADANETLARANLSFAAGLIATLDARDRYTAGHSAAVAIYCRDIARRMDFHRTQEKAYLCGLVHDIGKIGLPAGLLEKPGASRSRNADRCKSIGDRRAHLDDEWIPTKISPTSFDSTMNGSTGRVIQTGSAETRFL